MSTVTPFHATRLGDYTMDREQAAADEAQFQKGQRDELRHQRVMEIQEARQAALSVDDIQFAFDKLSTSPYRDQLARLRTELLAHDHIAVFSLIGMIEGVLVSDSIDQAIAEFKTLDAIKTDEVH